MRRSDFDHVGHDFVPHDLRKGDERGHGAVAGVLEVHEDLFRIRATDAREPRLQHHPVIGDERGVRYVFHLHRRRREVSNQPVRVGGGRIDGLGVGEEDQCFHDGVPVSPMSAASPMAAAPARKVSMSPVLNSAMDFMSGE